MNEGFNERPSPQTPEETNILKERKPQSEGLSAQEYSKENMAVERQRIAAEIRQERLQGRDKLAELKVRANLLKNKLEHSEQGLESTAQELEQLRETRDERTNSLLGRFRSFLHIGSRGDGVLQSEIAKKEAHIETTDSEKQQTEKDLEDSANQLVDADSVLKGLSSKISRHYQDAEQLARQPSVQSVMQKADAFFVHMIMSDNELGEESFDRGNALTKKDRTEDSVDLILSLEPSIAVSSVVPGKDDTGKVSGMWGSGSGLLIAGGRISAGGEGDLASVATGFKDRSAHLEREASQTPEDIEHIAGTRSGEFKWNEFIVNNPEACGFFTSIRDVDANGTTWVSGKNGSAKVGAAFAEQLFTENPEAAQKVLEEMRIKVIEPFTQEMKMAQERGLPFYVMTPDRRFYEVKSINTNGSLAIGEEFTPAKAASGNAGLTAEKRKEVGKSLLEKGVFRTAESQEEAEKIVDQL
jgi:hypothetical protein